MKETISIVVNGEDCTVKVRTDTPLLWVLRDTLKLTGTKFGCGMGLCSACISFSLVLNLGERDNTGRDPIRIGGEYTFFVNDNTTFDALVLDSLLAAE